MRVVVTTEGETVPIPASARTIDVTEQGDLWITDKKGHVLGVFARGRWAYWTSA